MGKKIRELQRQKDRLTFDIEQLNALIGTMEDHIKSLKADLDAANSKVTETEKEKQRLKNVLEDTEEILNELRDSEEIRNAKLRDEQYKATRLRENRDEMSTTLIDVKREMYDMADAYFQLVKALYDRPNPFSIEV